MQEPNPGQVWIPFCKIKKEFEVSGHTRRSDIKKITFIVANENGAKVDLILQERHWVSLLFLYSNIAIRNGITLGKRLQRMFSMGLKPS